MPGKKVKGGIGKEAGRIKKKKKKGWKAAAEMAYTGPLTFHLSLPGYW